MSVFMIGMLAILFLLGGLIIFIGVKPDKYVENQQFLRKVFYFVFITFLIFETGFKEIDITDWKTLSVFVIFSVFIDLTIFQTPSITKFLNAEFQESNYVVKTIQKNEEALEYTNKKVQNLTEVISKTPLYFEDKDFVTNWRKYKEELIEYLNLYTDTFQFNIAIFGFKLIESEEELTPEIEKVFNKVEICYNKSINDSEWRDELIKNLSDGQAINFINKGEDKESVHNRDFKKDIWIVPFYGESYNMLIGLRSTGIELNGVDASHILNLAKIFDWHMID